jgi:uncharacterized protein YjbI with pentapeptide repeats
MHHTGFVTTALNDPDPAQVRSWLNAFLALEVSAGPLARGVLELDGYAFVQAVVQHNTRSDPSLDAERNRSVTLFLLDSGLTGAQVGAEESSVSVLNDILLEDANLSRAFLLSADLVQAGLSNSDLHNAVLFQANLSDAVVIEANLSEANLNEANLAGAELIDTDLSGASLEGANLGLSNVSGVRADLSSADLSGAYLTDAKVTAEQLDECESLKGATMPNGQKYEDWLKSRGQDGENE